MCLRPTTVRYTGPRGTMHGGKGGINRVVTRVFTCQQDGPSVWLLGDVAELAAPANADPQSLLNREFVYICYGGDARPLSPGRFFFFDEKKSRKKRNEIDGTGRKRDKSKSVVFSVVFMTFPALALCNELTLLMKTARSTTIFYSRIRFRGNFIFPNAIRDGGA